jgi:uncharacterized protein YjiS (DUF1127 family)
MAPILVLNSRYQTSQLFILRDDRARVKLFDDQAIRRRGPLHRKRVGAPFTAAYHGGQMNLWREAMCENDQFYFLRFEHRPLTPEQWSLLQRHAARNAHRARAGAFRHAFVLIAGLAKGAAASLWRGIGKAWKAYVGWRERRAAIGELSRLDDRMLKDMGLHRSEIESVIFGRDAERMNERKAAVVLAHKPDVWPAMRATPGTTQRIDRSAA